jgi:hypothetical protein
MNKVAAALEVLRNDELLEEMVKEGGVLRGLGNVLKAGDKAGQAASHYLATQGHKNLAVAARIAPAGFGVLAAKKAYESGPVQGAKRKVQEYKYRKAVKRAQRGY